MPLYASVRIKTRSMILKRAARHCETPVEELFRELGLWS